MKDVQGTMPVLERFVVLMSSDHTSRSQRINDARNVFCLFAQKGRTLETSCLLTMIYYFTVPTKMDIVEDSVLMGKIKGIIRVRCVNKKPLCST